MATETPAPQIPLDAGRIERFLGAHADLRDLTRRMDRAGARPDDAQVRREVAALLARHGFADMAAWSATVRAVTIATAFADPDNDFENIDANLARSLAEIEAETSLSATQKAEMIAELQAERDAIVAMRPPPGNVEAVRPFLERLKRVVAQ
jgi:hypothetical protein